MSDNNLLILSPLLGTKILVISVGLSYSAFAALRIFFQLPSRSSPTGKLFLLNPLSLYLGGFIKRLQSSRSLLRLIKPSLSHGHDLLNSLQKHFAQSMSTSLGASNSSSSRVLPPPEFEQTTHQQQDPSTLHRQLLAQLDLASILITQDLKVVHISKRAERYLQNVTSESDDLPKLVHPGLQAALQIGLSQALEQQSNLNIAPAPIDIEGRREQISIHIRAVPNSSETSHGYLLVFFESGIVWLDHMSQTRSEQEHSSNLPTKLEQSKRRFRITRRNHRSARAKHQSINRKLSNRNLTLKKQLSSVTRSNGSFETLFNASELGLIVLDHELSIQKCTPTARELFKLGCSKLAHPLSQVENPFSTLDLVADAESVLLNQQTIVREVSTSDGQTYVLRIVPYHWGELEGVLLSFFNISERKSSEIALQDINDKLEKDAKQRLIELAEVNRIRHDLLKQLITAREDERQHIAREIHDSLGQFLSVLTIRLSMIKNDLNKMLDVSDNLAILHMLVEEMDNELDRLTLALRPSALNERGFSESLREYVQKWTSTSGIPVELLIQNLEGFSLPAPIETTIYRVIQEGLNNVAKHAQASQVSILVVRRAHVIRLILEDNGRGFASNEGEPEQKTGRQVGLIGMRERAALLGGTIAIESELGRSTTLYLTIPY